MDDYVHAFVLTYELKCGICVEWRVEKSSFFLLVWNDTKRMIQSAMGEKKKFTKNDSIDCHAQYTIIIYSMYYGRSIMYSIGWIVKFLRQNESTISSEFNCI